MLELVGNPFYDVGAATVAAWVGKPKPSEVTLEDCREVASYIEDNYTIPPLRSALTISLMNSAFTQPAYWSDENQLKAYARLVAGSFEPDAPKHPTEICVFTGEPALDLPLTLNSKSSLPPGRAFRQHLPLVTGEGVINFSTLGDPGIPISGKALLCFHILPMGCFKCGGRLLAVHSDHPELLVAFAAEALRENRNAVSLTQQAHQTKLPEFPHSAQTLLIKRLIEIQEAQRIIQKRSRPARVVAYHFTNSGQASPLDRRNPLLQMYSLPSESLAFLASVVSSDFAPLWKIMAARAWEQPRAPSKRSSQREEPFVARRNYLYEALFELPEHAGDFLHAYLRPLASLRVAAASASLSGGNGISENRLQRGSRHHEILTALFWPLIELFVREVMHMDAHRLEEIRQLGKRLADYVYDYDDERFFRELRHENRFGVFRNRLLKANDRSIKGTQEIPSKTLISLDSFLTVFEQAEGVPHFDWRYARDLVYLRMVDLLADKWMARHPNILPDSTEISEVDEPTRFDGEFVE